MQSDLDGLLETVRAVPEEDLPRLVFADWLEEHDQPQRAELIRVQCRLVSPGTDLETRRQLQQRERQLLDRYATEWLGLDLSQRSRAWRYIRGFPEVVVSADRLPQLAQAIGQAWVQTLRIVNARDYLDQIVSHPALHQVATLDLSRQELRDQDLRRILRDRARGVPEARLPVLDLRGNQLMLQGIETLFARSPLSQVPQLLLDGNPLSQRARRWLEQSPWAADYLPTPPYTQPRNLLNTLGMRLVRVPGGTFLMGSPKSEAHHEPDEVLHRVTLTQTIYVGIGPVTQEEFTRVLGYNPARFQGTPSGGPFHPVEQVSWLEAYEFCRRLSALPSEASAGRSYRLPTEAEWEFLCRAGTQTAYTSGDALLPTQANYSYRVGHTTPIGSYPHNNFGVHDMHGNVREWCADWYLPDYYFGSPEQDPTGPTSGTTRVIRGGAWDAPSPWHCRSAYRVSQIPEGRSPGVGFRVVCELAPPPSHGDSGSTDNSRGSGDSLS